MPKNPIWIGFFSILLMVYGCNTPTPRASRTPSQIQGASATMPPARQIEVVGRFDDAMPTGVAVSKTGRIFLCFPRWGDAVDFTVGELIDGKPVAYPNAQINRLETAPDAESFISVQSVVIDDEDRLWILDTGSINMAPAAPGQPKLVCVDLKQNRVIKTIRFPDTVALPSSYLNDVRFDLKRGQEGMAYITDSTDKGPNGIIVIDLASQSAWRKLNDDPSTKADQNFEPIVEGSPLLQRQPNQPPQHIKMGSDGIAIDLGKGYLYYSPLASRKLSRIKLDALAQNVRDEQTASQVEKMPPRNFASDGLLCDRDGTLYLTDYEHNAIHRYDERTKSYPILVSNQMMIWPDSMSLGPGNHLYFTANQLNRQPRFNDGKDLRQKPYLLLRIALPSQPVASQSNSISRMIP